MLVFSSLFYAFWGRESRVAMVRRAKKRIS